MTGVARVQDIVSEAASRWPHRVAVADADGLLTYRELNAAVDALARDLVAHGLGAGQGLGLVAGNGRAFVIGLFAGLKAGAAVMPISPQLAEAEIVSQVADAGLHAVLDDRGVRPPPGPVIELAAGEAAFGFRRTALDRGARFVAHVDDPAFVRFTSGTTGRSKGVVLGHQAVLERTEAAREALGIGPDDVVVWVLPMAFHFVVSVVMYVRYGATIAVCREMLAQAILSCAARHRGTLLYAAPTHYRMLAADVSDARLTGLRLAVSTSSGIPRDVALAFHERFGLPISQVYGIIEVGIPMGNLTACELHPEAIGTPMPGFEVGVLDDDGEPVAPGQIGHLGLRGPGMFDAYLDPPALRAEVLQDGWFMTGDLARVDEDGLVFIAGRAKSMINTAGLKVFPEEVEAVLDAHPDVQQSRVYGKAHPVMGEVVVADVIAARPDLDVDALRAWCRQRLSTYKIPHKIAFVQQLPQTATGKVRRHASGG